MSLILLKKIVLPGMELIESNIDLLTELDSITGDGDHGVTMSKITSLIKERLEKLEDNVVLANALDDLSWDLMNINGGSAGPLWGAYFEGMGIGAGLSSNNEAELFINMLTEAYKNFYDVSKADPGNKTMMDAIYPAHEIMIDNQDMELSNLAELMAVAAVKGANDTINMVAVFGRARSLKEKSLGHKDPGAVSFSLFYRGIAEGLK